MGTPTGTGAAPIPVDRAVIDAIVDGHHHDPHSVLGPHPHGDACTIRVIRPFALSVVIVTADGRTPARHEHRGVWTAVLPGSAVPDYRLEVRYSGDPIPADDPYRFLPTLGELDLHLLHAGQHQDMFNVLGAHEKSYPSPMGDVHGTAFAVWAPNAQGVQVVGNFNHWDGSAHPMRSLGISGVWELFIPYVGAGEVYKFRITGSDGVMRDKADPMAQHTEVPPATASIVHTSGYAWNDETWIEQRSQVDPRNAPMSVYEVHLGSWRRGLSYRELAEQLTDYVLDQGFTHVEFLPVAQHPYEPSWGYQVTGYFAPNSRFGNPDDLRHLIDTLHRAGIGVIVDWVPAHFPKDEWALARFDGTALYEHADPRLGEHMDWGTYIFDFGRSEVRNFLVANAVYWVEQFHVDALRVDAVASMLYRDYSRDSGQWVPNQYGGRENLEAVDFLREMTSVISTRNPGVMTIAEESTSWPGVTNDVQWGGLGFDLKWNMGWMHDTLEYMKLDPVYKQYHHNQMTFSLVYAWSEKFILPLSHDEVVHGKGSLIDRMPGDRWQKLASLRAYYGFMWAHPGKQLLFMGSEFAQSAEWNSGNSLDWWLLQFDEHKGIAACVRDLNAAYKTQPALWQRDNEPAGFEWLDSDDAEHNTFAWLRRGHGDEVLVSVTNFSPVPLLEHVVAFPHAGTWTEALNTDDSRYGGSGLTNGGSIVATDNPHFGRPASAQILVPPMATVWFTPES
jgi:1,4-alpha-glucan branching enzyme